MDIKAILKECKGLSQEAETKLELLERLKAQEQSCTAQLSDMPRGSEISDKSKITDKRIMLEEDLGQIVIRLNDTKAIIETLPDVKQQMIFTEHYINNKTWSEIKSKVNCSYRHIHRLHLKGLKELSDDNNV